MPHHIVVQRYQVRVEQLRQQLEQAHYAWWREWKAQQPDFKIENIRFKHTVGWDKRFFSIQSAHNGAHWVWKATWIFMMGTGQVI